MQHLRLFVTVLSIALLYGVRARARCCGSQADCPRGIFCAGGVCAVDMSQCNCDADCPPGLRCLPHAMTLCIQTEGGPQTCSLAGQCGAGWQMPCSSSTDCGEGGFECVQGRGTICTGSVCQTTAECNGPTLPSTCTIDADCPTGWTCKPDTAESTECVPTMHSCPPTGCPPLTGRMACRPPYWELVGDIRWTGAAFTPGICPIVDGGTDLGTGGTSGTGGSTTLDGGAGGVIAAGGSPQAGSSAATGVSVGGAGPTGSAAGGSVGEKDGTTSAGATASGPSGGVDTSGSAGGVPAGGTGGSGGRGSPGDSTGGAGGPRSSASCSYHPGGRPQTISLVLVLIAVGGALIKGHRQNKRRFPLRRMGLCLFDKHALCQRRPYTRPSQQRTASFGSRNTTATKLAESPRDTSSEFTPMVVVLSSRVLATPPMPISTSAWAICPATAVVYWSRRLRC